MPARDFRFPVLLADIGGTNARFALIAEAGAPVSLPLRLPTAGYARFEDAAREAIRRSGWPAPRTLLVGAAGPVRDRSIDLTNARWSLRHDAILEALGLDQGLLLNDFEVLSLALPHFSPSDLLAIGTGRAADGARLVVGPGTGLGVGALVRAGDRLLPVSSEGGHVGLPPETAEEQAVYAHLGLDGRRAQAEMLLAGPGLPALYRALAVVNGWPVRDLESAAVVAGALGEDPAARAAVRFQLDLLARYAGDMALTFLALGGVYLGGGMLPRIRSLIDPVAFRARFARNEAHAALLAGMPVWLITAEEPAFIGLAALARRPSDYWLDYEDRLWA